jgi:hypothetical protein
MLTVQEAAINLVYGFAHPVLGHDADNVTSGDGEMRTRSVHVQSWGKYIKTAILFI